MVLHQECINGSRKLTIGGISRTAGFSIRYKVPGALALSIMLEALKRTISSAMGSVPKTTHKDFDVEDVLEKLNIDEKIALLSGTDFWHTASVPRLGVPAIRVSDGPNGVRGTKFFNGVPAACLPCGKHVIAC